MATTFDVTSYPLETSTAAELDTGIAVDEMDDNSQRLRVLTTSTPINIRCVFNPLDEEYSADFETYLFTNRDTNFSITHNGFTYDGYIDGASVVKTPVSGTLHKWRFDFVGVVQ